MSAVIEVKINNLEKLRQSIRQYPQISAPRLASAINASLATIEKEAAETNEYGGIFQFKWPRSMRTGFLAQSFGLGIRTASAARLQGSIGPTAHYAVIVHEGLGSMRAPNPFMVRIVKKAEPEVNRHFKKTLDLIVEAIANQSQ